MSKISKLCKLLLTSSFNNLFNTPHAYMQIQLKENEKVVDIRIFTSMSISHGLIVLFSVNYQSDVTETTFKFLIIFYSCCNNI